MPESVFKTRKASILIAEQSTGVRPIMSAVMRELGFDKVASVDSLDEALSVLSTERVDWLITSVFADTKTNGLQILKLARQEPSLQRLKISLLASPDERLLLPKAFALGLLSCHDKPFNKDTLKQALADVLAQLEGAKWHPTLAAAAYLRPLLKAANDRQALLGFEQALSEAFPEDAPLLLHLAEAHVLAGAPTVARALLWQAQERDPSLSGRVAELTGRLSGKAGGDAPGSGDPWQGFGLGTCLVVDPDATVQAAIKESLLTAGATEVCLFDDGERCWEQLKDKEPDLLVMEWRIPGVPSTALLQRCRSAGFQKMSVIVHSSLVQKTDEPLLREMGVTEVMRKPFRKDDFLNCLAATVGQWQRPTEVKALERKVRALILAGDLADATRHMQLYLTKCAAGQEAAKAHLGADFAFAAKNFQAARDLGIRSMRLGNKSVALLNLLGKALMQLREFAAALQVFQRANDIAPNSVARLCAMAETQQELGDTSAAKETLDRAKTLDPKNQDVINTTVNLGLSTGDAAAVQGAIDHYRPTDSILAYVNNKAIAHARAGEFEASIQLYVNALAAIPADKDQLRTTIAYNLALAQARKNDAQAVIEVLEKYPRSGDDELTRKTTSLLARARSALATGKAMRLFTDPTLAKTAGEIEKSAQDVIDQFGAARAADDADTAQLAPCCYGLYKDVDLDGDLVKGLLAELPRFQYRGQPV